jgi:hypothetical protein
MSFVKHFAQFQAGAFCSSTLTCPHLLLSFLVPLQLRSLASQHLPAVGTQTQPSPLNHGRHRVITRTKGASSASVNTRNFSSGPTTPRDTFLRLKASSSPQHELRAAMACRINASRDADSNRKCKTTTLRANSCNTNQRGEAHSQESFPSSSPDRFSRIESAPQSPSPSTPSNHHWDTFGTSGHPCAAPHNRTNPNTQHTS